MGSVSDSCPPVNTRVQCVWKLKMMCPFVTRIGGDRDSKGAQMYRETHNFVSWLTTTIIATFTTTTHTHLKYTAVNTEIKLYKTTNIHRKVMEQTSRRRTGYRQTQTNGSKQFWPRRATEARQWKSHFLTGMKVCWYAWRTQTCALVLGNYSRAERIYFSLRQNPN